MTSRAGFERVRAALDGAGVALASHSDGSIRGRCPLHGGTTRTSLSLRWIAPAIGDRCGRTQLRCWAGCDERDILDHIGLGLGDLYDEPPPALSGQVRREHVYLDGAGRLAAVVRRADPKTFRPASPTADGWRARAGEQLPVLPYRLPEVVAAVAEGKPVYVVEGERDADALTAAGQVATCNAGGAGKWREAHSHWLAGAHVIVCRDRDPAGHRHAEQVVASLRDVAASVRLVEPTEGKDVADHLDAGRTVDDLVDVHLDEPDDDTGPAPVLVSLADVTPERLTWLWEGRMPRGKLVVVDGDPSVGKSTLAVTLAAHVSTGKPWPDGAPCEAGDVLILSAEDGLADTIRPRLDAAEGDPARVHALTAVRSRTEDGEPVERPVTLADIPEIRAAVLATNAVLVVIDVLMAFLPGKVDSHKDQDIRGVLSRLTRLGEDTGCTFVLLRHLNKAGGGSPMYRGGGSIGIVGAARAGFLVARDPDDPDTRVMACVKSNLAREPESLAYRLESAPGTDVARVVWLGASTLDATGLLRTDRAEHDEQDEVEAWLLGLLDNEDAACPVKQVQAEARAAGFSYDQAKRAKKRLGVVSEKQGMDGGWQWRLPDEGSTKGAKGAALREPPSSLPSVLPSGRCSLCKHPEAPGPFDSDGRCSQCA